jgi:hypothetical protein
VRCAFGWQISIKSASDPLAECRTPSQVIPALFPVAFTLTPHLQLINYDGCFSWFAGI